MSDSKSEQVPDEHVLVKLKKITKSAAIKLSSYKSRRRSSQRSSINSRPRKTRRLNARPVDNEEELSLSKTALLEGRDRVGTPSSEQLGGGGIRALSTSDIEHSFCKIALKVSGTDKDVSVAYTQAHHNIYGQTEKFEYRTGPRAIETKNVGGFNAAFVVDTPLLDKWKDYVFRVSHQEDMTGHDIINNLSNIKAEYITQRIINKMPTKEFRAYGIKGNLLQFNGSGADFELDNLTFPVYGIGVFQKLETPEEPNHLDRHYHLYSILPKSTAGDLSVLVNKALDNSITEGDKDKIFVLVQIAIEKSRQAGEKYMLLDNKCENIIVRSDEQDLYLIDFDSKFTYDRKIKHFPNTTITATKKIFQNFNMICILCSILNKLKNKTPLNNFLYSFCVLKLGFILLTNNFIDIYTNLVLSHTDNIIKKIFNHYKYPEVIEHALSDYTKVDQSFDALINPTKIIITPPDFQTSKTHSSSLPSSGHKTFKTVRKYGKPPVKPAPPVHPVPPPAAPPVPRHVPHPAAAPVPRHVPHPAAAPVPRHVPHPAARRGGLNLKRPAPYMPPAPPVNAVLAKLLKK